MSSTLLTTFDILIHFFLNMNFNFRLMSICVVFLLIHLLVVESYNERSFIKTKPKPRRKVLNVMADKIIEYFDLENKLTADHHFDEQLPRTHDSKVDENYRCENMDSISKYFLDVYSENGNLTAENLELLITRQILKAPHDDLTMTKSRRRRCKRKRVYYPQTI